MSTVPIIGIGASAGGLKALECFFKNMPSSKDAAFVIIQHLSPNYKSILADIVTRYTQMGVSQIKDKTIVEVGKVYIIPPNKLLTLDNGRLILSAIPKDQKINLPIDVFFRSLKDNLGEKAVAVILSGTGSDGTLGIKEIKEAGGLTIVQQPDTADYGGMPLSAINTGLIDFVIPVDEMPKVIIDYVGNEFKEKNNLKDDDKKFNNYISQIFELVKAQTGNDFSLYKKNTIYRRIERRLTVNKLSTIKDYIELLKNSNTEVGILNKEFLISVTSFFRDVETFNYIKKHLVSNIVSGTIDNNLRIWIPACATGEEAYSWAILFRNYIDDNNLNIELQVFASDIDADAIEKARKGFYTKNIIADVPQELLEKYFIEDKNGYRVKKSIRETVIFAEQNFLQDPPYSRLDMISCRNFLIYLDNTLQQKALSIAQYALNPEGVLVLGNAESLGNSAQYFKIIDRKFKIFQKIDDLVISSRIWKLNYAKKPEKAFRNAIVQESIADLAKEHILGKHTPPSVVVDANGNMLFAQGRTGRYLEISTGEITTNIIKIARDGLKIPLSNALRKVKANNKELTHKNVRIKTNDDYEYVDVTVSPLLNDKKETKLYIVLFQPSSLVTNALSGNKNFEAENHTIYKLEKELAEKEQYLQNTIEELETANEELESSNEEAQSTNEELQSTNEELETSKEELQSLNEELSTTNNELSIKVDELNRVNSQLKNLLSATNIATIFLDKKLRIFNFTPAVSIIIQLQNSDIGRSITQFKNNLKYDTLVEDAEEVINTLNSKEIEVQNNDNRYFWMRILPYRNMDDSIEGAVITFTDITENKKQEEELEKYRNHLEELVTEKSAKLLESEAILKRTESITRVGSWEWEIESDTIVWSDELHNIFSTYKEKGLPGYNKHKVIYTEDSQKLLDKFVKNAIEKGEPFETELEYVKGNGETGFIHSYGFPQINEKGKVEKLFGSVQEITENKKAKQELIRKNEYIQRILDDFPIGIATNELDSLNVNFINAKFSEIYGWPPEDFPTTLEFFNKVFPDKADRERLQGEIMADIESGDPQKMHWENLHITTKNGEKRIVNAYNIPFADQNIMVSTVQDVTKQKNAEIQIKEEKEKFKILADNTFDWEYWNDPVGNYVYLSPSCERITGYKPEEFIQNPNLLTDITIPKHKKQVKKHFNTITEKGPHSEEFIILNRDGEEVWIEHSCVPVYDEKGTFKGRRGVNRDITIRKEAKLKLEESYSLLSNLTSMVPGVVYQYRLHPDGSSAFPFSSSGMYDIYGVTPDEVKEDASPVFTRIHPDDYDNVVETITKSAENLTVYHSEFRVILPEQGLRWRLCDAKPERLEDGSTLWHGIISDITNRKNAEKELIKAKEKAEESDRLKSAFLANMSHEIRTPMNGILGFTELLKEPDLNNDQQQQYIKIIQKSGDRMLNTVNDIIEISKIDSGQVTVSTTKVNISKHLKSLHEFFSLEAESKGLKLILDNKLSEDDSFILCDKNKLSSILTNLIKNAIKFTEKGTIKIGCKKNKNILELFIKDSGIGIPANRQDAIFNRFEQADIEDKMAHEGSGLGLAITKSYVEILGGNIWVESEENKGSTFFFTLPHNTAKTETKTKKAGKKQKENKLKKLNILVVEDDETSYLYLSTLLSDITEKIHVVNDGSKAVEFCKNNSNIDLVLMDIKLPVLNGLQATQKIREFNKEIVIIAQTAQALEGDKERAIEVGCNDFVSKPINNRKLLARIGKHF